MSTDDDRSEGARQVALDRLQVTAFTETAYDDLTRLAAQLCDTPVALVSLIDGDRQWFKSHFGTEMTQTPRSQAFCAHAIQSPDRVMVVEDASVDPRFRDNPLVTGEPRIRFYAGAPLVSSSGHALGTICILDTAPRTLSAERMDTLRFLAQQVVAKLEERAPPSGSDDRPAQA
ncbi:MAG: GAF domain-containing protein [Caldimonas sp.]